jgi:hypothetical protein
MSIGHIARNSRASRENLAQALGASANDWIVFCHGAMGDTYLSLSLMAAFRAAHVKPGQRLLFAISKRNEGILGYFPGAADQFYSVDITPSVSLQLEALKEQAEFRPGNFIATLPNEVDDGYLGILAHSGRITNLDLHKTIYRLPLTCAVSRPQVSHDMRQRGQALADRYGLSSGNSVILIPHAKSMLPIPLQFWSAAASTLSDLGYQVFTDTSAPVKSDDFVQAGGLIPGTRPIQFGFDIAIAVCEIAGHVVANRSGISDLLSTSQVRLANLWHAQGGVWDQCPYEYISLTRMGLRDDELVIDPTLPEAELALRLQSGFGRAPHSAGPQSGVTDAALSS